MQGARLARKVDFVCVCLCVCLGPDVSKICSAGHLEFLDTHISSQQGSFGEEIFLAGLTMLAGNK